MSSACAGDLDRAVRAAAASDFEAVLSAFRALDPEALPDDDRFAWIVVLAQAMHLETAAALLASIRSDDLALRARAILEEAHGPEPGEDPDDPFEVEIERRPVDAERQRAVVEAFVRFFAGRRDIYAKAWFDEKRRRSGYHPVEQPLTETVARAHLEGRVTIGQYLLFPDCTCSFGVVDLDLSSNEMENLRTCEGEAVSPLRHEGLRGYARRLVEAGARLGIPLFAEDSGGKGAHAWVFLEPRRAARAVRALLAQVVAAAGPIPPGVAVEIFPKQDKTGPKGLSSLVKLPLGRHPATLRPCAMLDDLGHPIEEPAAALARLRTAPIDAVDAVVGRRVVVLPAPELERAETVPALTPIESPRTLAEAMRAVEPGEPERQACDRMLAGCRVLQSLVTRAFEQHRLGADEARALLYTLGLVGPANRMIEQVFAAGRVSTKELDRVRRGLPSPAGCAKLERVAPGPCACFAGRKPLPYATPALFAVGEVRPAEPRWKPFAQFLDADERVVADPLETIGAALERIEARLEKLEGTGTGAGTATGAEGR
jgi:hypothetical protein